MKVIVASIFPPSSVEWKAKIYKPGEALDLPDREARRLLDLGLVTAPEKKEPENRRNGEPEKKE